MSQKTDKIILVLLLGGSGNRFNSRIPKQYIRLNHHSHPLFIETIINIRKNIPLADLILVGNPEYMTEEEFLYPLQKFQENEPDVLTHVIEGGATRHESFLKGASVAREHYNEGIVLVHDANRPYISAKFSTDILTAIKHTSENSPCHIPVIPSTDSLCRTVDGKVREYLPRNEIHKIQTPQILHLKTMITAIEKSSRESSKQNFTDEGSFMHHQGFNVKTYPGDNQNIKITYPEDL